MNYQTTLYRNGDHRQSTIDYLLHEIAFFESRLREMHEGDCAYEHALSRAYRQMLQERRGQLAILSA